MKYEFRIIISRYKPGGKRQIKQFEIESESFNAAKAKADLLLTGLSASDDGYKYTLETVGTSRLAIGYPYGFDGWL